MYMFSQLFHLFIMKCVKRSGGLTWRVLLRSAGCEICVACVSTLFSVCTEGCAVSRDGRMCFVVRLCRHTLVGTSDQIACRHIYLSAMSCAVDMVLLVHLDQFPGLVILWLFDRDNFSPFVVLDAIGLLPTCVPQAVIVLSLSVSVFSFVWT